MPKTRIFYIDAIKAIAIILMITMHIPEHWHFQHCFWSTIADIFCMGTFFVLSGMTTNIENFQVKRRLKILIPFLFLGIACTLFYNRPLESFLTTMDKNGYWFLWVIAIFSLFIYFIHKTKINIHLGFILTEIFLIALYVIADNKVRYILSINLCVMYWPYVYFGWVIRSSQRVFTLLIEKTHFTSLLFLIFVSAYLYMRFSGIHASLLFTRLFAFPIIAFILMIMNMKFGKKAASGKVEYFVSLIGTNTLQIYVLHYFILRILDTQLIQTISVKYSHMLDDILITPILSFVIALICIALSKVLYKARLGFIFGR